MNICNSIGSFAIYRVLPKTIKSFFYDIVVLGQLINLCSLFVEMY